MSRRQKINRYDIINADEKVIKWLHTMEKVFVDRKNIVLELACGRGEYTIGLADATKKWLTTYDADTLFVGVDQKWDRISLWLQRMHELWLANTVAFLWGIINNIERWLEPASVHEMRIIHPDPRPRWCDEKRRLTHPRFLAIYENILQKNGLLRLKTDDRVLFDYSVEQLGLNAKKREMISLVYDLHEDALALQEHFGVQTHYEKLALQEWRKICYGVWRKIV